MKTQRFKVASTMLPVLIACPIVPTGIIYVYGLIHTGFALSETSPGKSLDFLDEYFYNQSKAQRQSPPDIVEELT